MITFYINKTGQIKYTNNIGRLNKDNIRMRVSNTFVEFLKEKTGYDLDDLAEVLQILEDAYQKGQLKRHKYYPLNVIDKIIKEYQNER